MPFLLSACPQNEELAAFVECQLNREAKAAVIRHLATCLRCREVVKQVVFSKRRVADIENGNPSKG